ncbi:unnamed protein product [Mytilus coruscus]|uniref:Uncharacterized protein n=1 Tax=Mytilus coruscus TaxID=42192 RepID=A0A6J8DQR5_MYTCO|nr:unnamed protein product [Mytilus coruscus]
MTTIIEKLKKNYVARVRYRKCILLLEVLGFSLYLAGFATPYWVAFLSEDSKLDSTRGLFATCVRTAGKLNCADISNFSDKLIVCIVFACLALISYIVMVVASLLVINWLKEQRNRCTIVSIVSNVATCILIPLTLGLYVITMDDLDYSLEVVFYLMIVSNVLVVIIAGLRILDFKLPEPKKRIPFSVPPLTTINQHVKTPMSKVQRKTENKLKPAILPQRYFPKPSDKRHSQPFYKKDVDPLFVKVLYAKDKDSDKLRAVRPINVNVK